MADDVDVDEFLADIAKLPPDQQGDLKRLFFEKYVAPHPAFSGGSVQGRRSVLSHMGLPLEWDIEGPSQGASIKAAPGFGERISNRMGGFPSAEQFKESPGRSALSAGFSALAAPGAAVGEAVDTAIDPLRGATKGRPLPPPSGSGMLGGMANKSFGDWGQEAANWTVTPKLLSILPMLMKSRLGLRPLNRYLNEINTRITTPEATAPAAAELPKPKFRYGPEGIRPAD